MFIPPPSAGPFGQQVVPSAYWDSTQLDAAIKLAKQATHDLQVIIHFTVFASNQEFDFMAIVKDGKVSISPNGYNVEALWLELDLSDDTVVNNNPFWVIPESGDITRIFALTIGQYLDVIGQQ